MPLFKKDKFSHTNKAGERLDLTISISINADGEFYFKVPEELERVYENELAKVKHYHRREGKIFANTYDEICKEISRAMREQLEVEVIEEDVIIYTIDADIKFATDEDGNVYPNASQEGTFWPKDEKKYNSRGSNFGFSNKGFSVSICAEAKKKVTHRYGEREKVEYRRMECDDDSVAGQLNSWNCSVDCNRAKEIPFTVEAAEFFNDMLYGVVKLGKVLMDRTFEQEDLLQLIESKQRLIGGAS